MKSDTVSTFYPSVCHEVNRAGCHVYIRKTLCVACLLHTMLSSEEQHLRVCSVCFFCLVPFKFRFSLEKHLTYKTLPFSVFSLLKQGLWRREQFSLKDGNTSFHQTSTFMQGMKTSSTLSLSRKRNWHFHSHCVPSI